MLEWYFFIFWIFFASFLGILYLGSGRNGIRNEIIFYSFLANCLPRLDRNITGMMFLIFWIFLLFFLELSIPSRVGTKFGMKILFSLSWPVQPGFAGHNARMIFLNFFAILLGILYSGYGRNGNRNEIFFISFLAYLNPIWIEIFSEWCFLIFWILLLFFLEFSSLGWVGTEFQTKIFFSFSANVSLV